jgi:hypothetical protein
MSLVKSLQWVESGAVAEGGMMHCCFTSGGATIGSHAAGGAGDRGGLTALPRHHRLSIVDAAVRVLPFRTLRSW